MTTTTSRPPVSFKKIMALKWILLCTLAVLLLLPAVPESHAEDALNRLEISLDLHMSGLSLPVHITHAGDGSGRLFVVEQAGHIRIIRNDALLDTPFLTLVPRVSCCGERGLFSVAFPPDYSARNYFYVNYTNNSGNTVIARYSVTPDPDIADPDSEEIILVVPQPFPNHNGGQIAFGQDGFLYIGMGDGGSGGDPQNNAQNPDTLLGKMLRIDVESGTDPYAIPDDNPFTQNPNILDEIWAFGLRNPWRFSFDRGNGDLYIGDVGQGSFEEIDFQAGASPGGENYGWRIMEGSQCFNPPTGCDQTGLTLPVNDYDHTQGCSVTGGTVYRGPKYGLMLGIYFYGDLCSGNIWGLQKNGSDWQDRLLLDTSIQITSFGENEPGELYVADYSTGNLYEVQCTEPFADVPGGFWAKESISATFCNSITAGCSPSPPMYCPHNTVTREQMAAFIIRAKEGEPAEPCTAPPFLDIPVNSFFCKHIERLKALGITSGFGDGTYRPKEFVTRAQIAAFIIRALDGGDPAGTCVSPPFSDVPEDHLFCRHIEDLKNRGILSGFGDGTYRPAVTVNRAQMAAFIAKAFLDAE
jgi:glucose/arabinose dehydrogenase